MSGATPSALRVLGAGDERTRQRALEDGGRSELLPRERAAMDLMDGCLAVDSRVGTCTGLGTCTSSTEYHCIDCKAPIHY